MLDLLLSVADTGSLGAAGRRHGMSQPAVSMRIRQLELQLGLRLVERSSTGSRLTPAGATVADWARPVVDAAHSLLVGADALRAEQTSRLRLAASMTVAEYLMPEWLGRFHGRHPEVAVALRMGNSQDVGAMVGERAVDLGFVEGGAAPAGLMARAIGDDELAVVVPPGHHWARRRRPITVYDLSATPLVLREPGSGTRQVLEHRLAEDCLGVTTELELESTTAIKAAVVRGQGPSVLSRRAVARELADGSLVEVKVEGLRLDRKLRAVWLPGHPLDPLAARFLAIAVGVKPPRRRDRTATPSPAEEHRQPDR